MSREPWRLEPVDVAAAQALAQQAGVSATLAAILMRRGVRGPAEAERFLRAGLEDLLDPLLLPDMPRAVARIEQAIAARELIRVWGDYDADGVSGAALLVRLLRGRGVTVDSYVPHRLQHGYGLNADGLRQALQSGVRLLIVVDVGTTAVEPIQALQASGVDVIVVDHHEPRRGQSLAPAFALINPKRSDSTYPDRHLTAAGLAFKCAQALCGREPSAAWALLDLACIGTISDLGLLTGENRVLIKQGLERLSVTDKPGLRALAGWTEGRRHSAARVGFDIGPRLNAAGRLGSAEAALQLLLTDSDAEARDLAAQLEEQNDTRRTLQQMVLRDALRLVEQEVNFREHRVIALASSRWHVGVVGVVAARLAERFRRPVILCAEENGLLRGSGRSANGFSLFEALADCEEHLEQYGGHQAACGVTLRRSSWAPFVQRLNALATAHVPSAAASPGRPVDAVVTLDQVTEPLLEELERLAPFGHGNPRPSLLTHGVQLCGSFTKSGRASLLGMVSDGTATMEASVSLADDPEQRSANGCRWDIVYTPACRRVRGQTGIRLAISDVQAHEAETYGTQ